MPSVCPCCSRSCLPCRIPRPFRPRMRGNRRKAGSCRGQRAAAGPCIHIAGPFVKSSCNVSGGNVLCPSMREPPRPAEPAERCRLPWRLRRPCGRMSLWRGAGLGKRRARRLQKGRRHMRSKESRPGQKHHPRPPRPAVPLPPERAWRPGQREIPPRRRPPGIRPKRGSPPLLSPLPDRRQARCPGPRRRQSLLRPEMRPLYPAQTARPVPQRGTCPRPSSTKRLPIRRD